MFGASPLFVPTLKNTCCKRTPFTPRALVLGTSFLTRAMLSMGLWSRQLSRGPAQLLQESGFQCRWSGCWWPQSANTTPCLSCLLGGACFLPPSCRCCLPMSHIDGKVLISSFELQGHAELCGLTVSLPGPSAWWWWGCLPGVCVRLHTQKRISSFCFSLNS